MFSLKFAGGTFPVAIDAMGIVVNTAFKEGPYMSSLGCPALVDSYECARSTYCRSCEAVTSVVELLFSSSGASFFGLCTGESSTRRTTMALQTSGTRRRQCIWTQLGGL